MFRKLVTLLLVALMINLVGVRFAYAESKEEKQARFADKIKANVLKLGTGESTRVKVKLRDQRRLEGYISDAGTETFTVTNRKTLPRSAKYRLKKLEDAQVAIADAET